MVTVTVTPRIREGPPMTGKSPYGKTLFGGIDQNSIHITTQCTPQSKDPNPDSAANLNKTCVCRLDTISFDADFVMRFNPKRIENCWLNWNTKDAYEAKKPKDHNDCKVDKANVETHERSHVDDIIKKIKEEIEKAINKNQDSYVCTRLCRQKDRCLESIKKMIAARITALGNKAWEDLTSDAEAHYRESDTEKTARAKQCQEIREKLEKLKEKNDKKSGKKDTPKKKPTKR